MIPWMRWLPWKFAVRRVARAHGFLDPIALLARLRALSQPSEVAEPIELLRAGAVMHARGLLNSRVIQHNLDWVWPYWVERQFDPNDISFVPRAFSITHINLTHRNWTAVGLPDCAELPVVDPRGLITPHLDGWSVDGWVITEDGRALLPSRATVSSQRLDLNDGIAVVTESEAPGLTLANRAEVVEDDGPACRITLTARADARAWAVFALRPYNPEGISPVDEVELGGDRASWLVDGHRAVRFDAGADRHHVSDFRAGDVHIHLADLSDEHVGSCRVGMTTAAAMFELAPGTPREIVATIPLADERTRLPKARTWPSVLENACQLSVPDQRYQELHDAALRTLLLHSPADVYPGPYTYKRFWFRDAAFMIHALLCMGLFDRAERALDQFPHRQTGSGYFHSQDGEWDSNGEALWSLRRYCDLTGRKLKPALANTVGPGASWIVRKRLEDSSEAAHAGLLPAGFSAEHLGPNDYYYWDDFWGVAGLRAAAHLAALAGDDETVTRYAGEAASLAGAIDRSLQRAAERLRREAMPAAPERRLDAGAIGSLAAGYPLQLFAPEDPRLLDTVEFLLSDCLVGGGFFQDMTHSGINAYLTLHMAQVLLRAGDPRHWQLIDAVATLATPTGQWPEAIHPATGGGCMGDGQHAWAAAEWLLMMRNCFVREEPGQLVLASGIPRDWLEQGEQLRFGPAPTPWGAVSLAIDPGKDGVTVAWQADWRGEPPSIEVRLAGYDPITADASAGTVRLEREPVA